MALAWSRPSWHIVAGAGAVVLLVATAAVGAWWWASIQESTARAAYAEAMSRLSAATAPQAPVDVKAATVRELEAVLARYPAASAAPQAALELGHLRYADRQHDRARAAYEIAVARGRSATLQTLARAGIGYTWEAERNLPKAIDAYRAALTGVRPGDFLYDQLMLDLARAQELASRKPDAIETYRRLLAERPTTPRADEIRARLAGLGAVP